jgi:hypothetical protein
MVGVGGQQSDFGQSVSIDGTRAAVGATGMFAHRGVYIFDFDGTNWNRTARIVVNDADIREKFGNAVSLEDGRILTDNHFDNDNGSFAGAAYIFELEAGVWIQKSWSVPSDNSTSYTFGIDVSLDGDKTLVRARGIKNGSGISVGAAYVFELIAGNWLQTDKLLASDGEDGDEFSISVHLDNNRAIIGATRDDDINTDSGAAYVFDFAAGVWTETTN